MLISYDKKTKYWKGSLRSNDNPINIIAGKFGGGGHKLASGFKIKNKRDYKKVLEELKNNE